MMNPQKPFRRRWLIEPPSTPEVKVVPAPAPAKVSLLTKVRRLGVALKRWQAAGRPVVSRETARERAAICQGCEYWRAGGNFGLGECRAPGCGCTRLKIWLATEKCPHPAGAKWPAVSSLTNPKI
jgi:hypothetical protein